MSTHALSFAQEASLFPTCALPGCGHFVDHNGDACGPCRAAWGPYLVRKGERPAWVPLIRPACGHSWTFWHHGRCGHLTTDQATEAAAGRPFRACGNTNTEPNPWPPEVADNQS